MHDLGTVVVGDSSGPDGVTFSLFDLGGLSMDRRIVGIDLGITSAHVVVIVDETGKVIARRRCHPNVESLEAIERAGLAGAAEGTVLEVVVEPTGPAWMPVGVFFARRGHRVFRVSSQKAADLRRFLSRHAKSNGIDAETLAMVAMVAPAHLNDLELPDQAMAGLVRRSRAADRLTDQIADAKVRIRDLARHVIPCVDEVFTNKFGKADLAVLEKYGDPRAIVAAGPARLTRMITKISNGQHGAERAGEWIRVSTAAVELFGADPSIPFDDIAAELASSARLLRALNDERDLHAKAREDHYRRVDPTGLARSLPGVAAIGGPVLVAGMGRAGRFADGAAFKKFTGLTPKTSGTGDLESKGQPISKAGSSRLRDQLVCSANVARNLDPQLAAVYYVQIVERGAHHTKALCVVAARLAERAWTVMNRGEPYVIRDLDGRAVSPAEAKQIIAERYTVPDEVRRRRRARNPKPKAGRAPQQVLIGT